MTARPFLIAAAFCLIGNPASGQEVIASVSQGTNMALALSPDGETLVVDLMGQLWSLPATGGGAQLLLPAEESARNPRFSPDGNQLVYQQYSRGQWDLWLLELATRTRRRLTGPPYNEREPDFSADGRAVIFVSDRSGRDALYRVDLATETVTRLTYGGEASWPAVSERGEIVYVERRGGEWRLSLRASTGASSTLLTSANPLRAPSWRPGGGVVLFNEMRTTRDSDLRMAVLSDEPVVKTLTSEEDVFGFRAAWRSPAEFIYTSDGQIWSRKLANATRYPIPLFAGVAVNRSPNALSTTVAPGPGPHAAIGLRSPRLSSSGDLTVFTALGDLWLKNEDGGLEQLTNDAYLDIDPTFEADAGRVIFASDRAGNMDLWAIDLETKLLDQLTDEPSKDYAPAISPDGSRVAYLSTEGFGPWAPAELRLAELTTRSSPQTLAQGLREAGEVAWSSTGNSITLRALDGRSAPEAERGPARFEFDLQSRTTSWSNSVSLPGRVLVDDVRAPALTWTTPESAEPYVIQVDRLFDGVSTQYRRHMDIHIEGDRITAVVARGLLPSPERVIDARGRTVIPGLIDLHAHHSALAGERLGRIWLAYGVTTVREVASIRDDGLERKESWASGRRIGPRLLLSARHNDSSGWPARAQSVRPNYDILEIYRGQPLQLHRSLIRDARQFGIPVFSEDLFPGVRLGINGLEHIGGRPASPFDLERSSVNRSYADVVSLLTQSGTAVTPTLAAFGGFGALTARRPAWATDPAYRSLYTPAERARWRRPVTAAELGGIQDTVATLIRSGGRVTAGSDAPSVPYGLGLHAELTLLTQAGVPNDRALRLVTAEAALALGLERELGTVEAGKLADLVIIDGNPLIDMTDSLDIEAVVRGGIWFDRGELLYSD
ncbi:MAG: amidohydrolase family protein [Gammaproteobacteria bacterium]|nr:amidohydrolase family protein [Gammaproteobacteria bacterium]MDH3506109.1 amidohydrolase family protein [Gammaproteobacteria bacterium]